MHARKCSKNLLIARASDFVKTPHDLILGVYTENSSPIMKRIPAFFNHFDKDRFLMLFGRSPLIGWR